MLHPYQCIATVQESGQSSILLAASGPRIICSDLQNGTILSEWLPEASATVQHGHDHHENEANGRPAKKQKTSNAPLNPPNVIKLAVSPSTRHVVAVTDDKCLRVFEHSAGKLTELSQRAMPKRACAVQFTHDSATILVADKFGDVYSLPLLASEADEPLLGAQEGTPQPETQFKPSATNLTVHSKRNRDALAAQMQQKNFTPRKEALKFEHKLLLGHVSMLTDMKYAQYQDGAHQKAFIITADRDEHIRVSRGPPQAHIIEGFCLGHSEFVSKITQVGTSNRLVSGGGDPWLGLWEWWPEPKLLNKIDLHQQMKSVLPSDTPRQLAVSGIWNERIGGEAGREEFIVVACEKVKGLLLLDDASLQSSANTQPTGVRIELSHNPIDVTFDGDRMFVSVDARRTSPSIQDQRVLPFQLQKRNGRIHADLTEAITSCKALNEHTVSDNDTTEQALDGLLYSVADLRKRRDQETHEEEQENDISIIANGSTVAETAVEA